MLESSKMAKDVNAWMLFLSSLNSLMQDPLFSMNPSHHLFTFWVFRVV